MNVKRFRQRLGQLEYQQRKSGREVNVWEAWSRKHDEPHYLVGHYDEETGLFWREARAFELRRDPKRLIIRGNFSEVVAYNKPGGDNYNTASNAAKAKFGYSLKGLPPDGAELGAGYGRLKLVVV